MGDYIRFFAATDGGAVSKVALEYVRSLIRAAPVRLISVSGLLHPSWMVFERLLTTDMSGKMLANVVCTEPAYWVKTIRGSMPKTETSEGGVIERDIELYTSNERNVIVLTTVFSRLSKAQMETANRYEQRISQTTHDTRDVAYTYIPTPVMAHSMLRHVVIGPPPMKEN